MYLQLGPMRLSIKAFQKNMIQPESAPVLRTYSSPLNVRFPLNSVNSLILRPLFLLVIKISFTFSKSQTKQKPHIDLCITKHTFIIQRASENLDGKQLMYTHRRGLWVKRFN